MPKDEFDFDDPLELNGVMIPTDEDTTGIMAECFIEEFMRLGYNHKQIFALFRNPCYTGMNLVLQKRGEAFVQDLIAELFARWGRAVDWGCGCGSAASPARPPEEMAQTIELDTTQTDPMGVPVPRLNS
jgi:hypothetical protein